MPGLRGTNRVPNVRARMRRNFNAQATQYDTRSLGDGLTLSTTRLLQMAIAATGGLEFVAGELSIKYPADGGVKTSAVGLEVDIAGMGTLGPIADTDVLLIEDVTGDAKKKLTIEDLRNTFNNPFQIRTITASATANATTDNVILCKHATVAIDLELPANGAILAGTVLYIKNIGVAVVTIDANTADGTQTVDDQGAPSVTLNQYDAVTVVSDGTEWWIL